jgi:hypothetical protein
LGKYSGTECCTLARVPCLGCTVEAAKDMPQGIYETGLPVSTQLNVPNGGEHTVLRASVPQLYFRPYFVLEKVQHNCLLKTLLANTLKVS